MKRFLSIAVALSLLLCLLPGTAIAADTSRSYDFALTVDGKQEVTVTPDQIVTVTLVLNRTDSDQPADMYAVQAELLYDDTFFELVENSVMTSTGVEWTDMARRTGGRAFYLNFLSLSGGEQWNSKVQMGSFQLRVIGQSGASVIDSDNCIVSVADGSDSFTSVSNDVKVIVSTDCTVTFESAGGSEVPDQIVQYGEKIQEPEEPTREGYTFNGWYSDLDKTDLWDFNADTVQGNMTLYAGWLEGDAPVQNEPEADEFPWWLILIGLLIGLLLLILILVFGKKKVTFDSCGGTPIDSVYVKKDSLVERPMTPVKPGAMFIGWYTDAQLGTPWNFERSKVKKSMTLYARWK